MSLTGMDINGGWGAPSLGPSGFIRVLTECALPCRSARIGQSRVVSSDQGISAGISAPVQCRQRIWRWGRVGGWGMYFCHKRLLPPSI